MTKVATKKVRCGVCKMESEQKIILSTSSVGCDLDMRPTGIARYVLKNMMQECPSCGYIAGNISRKHLFLRRYIQSDEYKTCGGLDIESELAKKFYKNYLLKLKARKYEQAFYSLLRCAWVSDDENDTEMAAFYRNKCLELIGKLKKSEKIVALKVDLLRRTDKFDEVISEYENLKMKDEKLDKVVRFQVELATNKDNRCYTFNDANNR